ncbi:hypothetical protein quinque_012327 [Culex quinquefasciatus]
MIDGHCYSRQRVRDRTIRWRCVQFKPLNCMARATTERQNGGKLISISGQHNHDLIRERRKNGELKELLAIRQAERGQRPVGDQPEEQFYVQNLREVHAVLSNRGKVQLMIDGFPFSREKVRPKTIRWICNQAWILNCKVRATSERTNGEIISVRGTHNHVVVNNRRQRGECKVIKEHARLYGPEQSEPRRKGGQGVSYITSQRGTTQLKINGHTFTRSQVRSRIIIWVFTQRRAHGCAARATTYQRGSQGQKLTFRGCHNHPVIAERRKAGVRARLVNMCKRERGDPSDRDIKFMICGKSRKLFIDGFSFTRKVLRTNYTIWECCQARPLGCKAGATSYQDASRVTVRGEHNHEIVTERRKLGQRKILMEERRLERISRKATC